jgi:hypothetical protein
MEWSADLCFYTMYLQSRVEELHRVFRISAESHQPFASLHASPGPDALGIS